VWPEKFQVIDPIGACDLLVVTELWKGGLQMTPIAHLVEGQGIEALYRLGMTSILMDVPTRSYHGVMGGKRKLYTGLKEGDITAMAAI
jgi:hypothetical protein